jgi:phosphoserine aminotransferase
MPERVYNFFAGPATLPFDVIKEVFSDGLNFNNLGMSVMEISHRSADFDSMFKETQNDLLEIMGLSQDDYTVLFLGGGASTQFCAIPFNFLERDMTADYVVTGGWAKKAVKEARIFGNVNIAATSEDSNFNFIPKRFDLTPSAAYVHTTSNNTLVGTQIRHFPETGDVPLVSDMSSAYATHMSKDSLFNTPPSFPVYVVGKVLKWIKNQGGLQAVENSNNRKAGLLYEYMDENSDFYRCTVADTESRSLMNVTFRLPSEELEKKFIVQGAENSLLGLKGHRSVGGCRASIYNAMPYEGVETLVDFMKGFKAAN